MTNTKSIMIIQYTTQQRIGVLSPEQAIISLDKALRATDNERKNYHLDAHDMVTTALANTTPVDYPEINITLLAM